MGEVSLIGITAILCQKVDSIWKNIDDSICRLEILKSNIDSKFRMVAMSTDNRCIFNKWIRTNSEIIKCSDLFLEIKQVSSQSMITEYIGVNFAYKNEVDKFYSCFSSCIDTLQAQRRQSVINLQPIQFQNNNEQIITTPATTTTTEDNLKDKNITISNSISYDSLHKMASGITLDDLPLPPPPTSSTTTNTVTFSVGVDSESLPPIDFSSLPPPPPIGLLNTSRSSLTEANGLEIKNKLSPLLNGHNNNNSSLSSSPTERNQLNSSTGSNNSSGNNNNNASHLTDLFLPNNNNNNNNSNNGYQTPPNSNLQPTNKYQNIITTTTTTTTTINIKSSGGSNSDSFLKTASGRRSIRVRHSTNQASADQQKKTMGRKDGLAVSLQNVEGLQNIAENLEDETLNLLDLVNEQVVTPQVSNNAHLNQSLLKIFEHLQVLFILTGQATTHPGAKLITQVTNKLSKGPQASEFFSGKADNQWYNLEEVKDSVVGIHNLLALKKNLISAIAHLSTGVRVLGLQASLEIDWMSRNKSSETEKIVVQLACLTRELISTMSKLLAATVTYCNVCATISNIRKSEISTGSGSSGSSPAMMSRIRSPSTVDTINIWDELKSIKTIPTLPKDGSLLKATLNQLVLMLTSETSYDSKFLKTFITTYQSFASPGILFSKLVERFYVPEWYSTVPLKISTIQQRVIVVLKYWIENQSSDFDQDVIDQIYFFINTLANSADGYSELARLLRELLDKVIQEREVKFELLFQMPPRITFEEDSILSPIELFSEWSAQSIAQQLTLIDFSVFKDLEARELLNQNFNKPKLKYKSPTIMRMISKSTQFSFWVAYVILMEPKKEKRIKIFEKFCEVGKYLLKMNNFNSLMGLNAGLNLTCVHRLKKTKKKLSSSAVAMLTELERIFSSKKSFKNYRDHLLTVQLPCIPYLGFHLTDITFIEEGNTDNSTPTTDASTTVGATAAAAISPQPSNVGPLINFKKRELLYQAWVDLSRFQETPYSFQPEEPLNTFLLNFPILDDKELYDLSVALEPK